MKVTGRWIGATDNFSAVPLGGLGTGYLDLNPDGTFGRATLENNWLAPAPPTDAGFEFGATPEAADGTVNDKMPPLHPLIGTAGGQSPSRYWGHYPMVDMDYGSAAYPVRVTLRAMSPFVPGNYRLSGAPAAIFRFNVHNPTRMNQNVRLALRWPGNLPDSLCASGNVAGALYWLKSEIAPNSEWSVSLEHLATQSISGSSAGREKALPLTDFILDENGGFNWEAYQRESGLVDGAPTIGQILFGYKFERNGDAHYVGISYAPGEMTKRIGLDLDKRAEAGSYPNVNLVNSELGIEVRIETQVTASGTIRRTFTLLDRGGAPLHHVQFGYFVNFDVGGPDQSEQNTIRYDPTTSELVSWGEGAFHAKLKPLTLPEGFLIGAWPTVRDSFGRMESTPCRLATTPSEQPVWRPFLISGGSGLWLGRPNSADGYAITAAGRGWQLGHSIEKETGDGRLYADRVLRPGQAATITFTLAWYFPSATSSDGQPLRHRYTKWFENAQAVAEWVTPRAPAIEKKIISWQERIYAAPIPGWLQDGLINSLYSLARNTLWLEDGRFYHSESFTGCPITETLVCRFNGSFPLLMLFPKLELPVMREFAQFQSPQGEIPFGFGSPLGIASPMFHLQRPIVTNEWILMVWRDYLYTGNRRFLSDMWPHVKRAMDFRNSLILDGDGLVNDAPGSDTGWPANQYYDIWPWWGTSPYVASIDLAALKAATAMAQKMGDLKRAARWQADFTRGQADFEAKLWNGRYYRLYNQPSHNRVSESCLADQLIGEMYARLLGLGDIVPKSHLESVVESVQRLNMAATAVGAVNGVLPDGRPDPSGQNQSLDSSPGEVWNFATTALYAGRPRIGLPAAERAYANLCAHNMVWNQYFNVSSANGDPVWGSDYYSNMCIWALPAGLSGKPLAEPGAWWGRL